SGSEENPGRPSGQPGPTSGGGTFLGRQNRPNPSGRSHSGRIMQNREWQINRRSSSVRLAVQARRAPDVRGAVDGEGAHLGRRRSRSRPDGSDKNRAGRRASGPGERG